MTDSVRIMRAQRLESLVAPRRWDFDLDRAKEIDAYWRAQTRANASLYDGPVLLAHGFQAGEEALSLRFFETRFSRFLFWRDMGFPDPQVYNCFSMPALRSCDGAFLLGEMSPGHSSAGKIYFPAGTPDPSDVTGETVDLLGSVIRELAEETGLAANEGVMTPGWTVLFDGPRIACMKIIEHPQSAEEILARVRGFIAREEKPELSDAVMVSRREQLDDPRLPLFMRAFLARELGF